MTPGDLRSQFARGSSAKEFKAGGATRERILFRNIGTLLSGDLAEPILSAASLLVEDGVISEIGTEPMWSSTCTAQRWRPVSGTATSTRTSAIILRASELTARSSALRLPA
jgi:hypothetical protein